MQDTTDRRPNGVDIDTLVATIDAVRQQPEARASASEPSTSGSAAPTAAAAFRGSSAPGRNTSTPCPVSRATSTCAASSASTPRCATASATSGSCSTCSRTAPPSTSRWRGDDAPVPIHGSGGLPRRPCRRRAGRAAVRRRPGAAGIRGPAHAGLGPRPESLAVLSYVFKRSVDTAGLDVRARSLLVAASASALGDSYCSLAFGTKLASVAGNDLAASVLTGSDEGMTDAERALATWARQVVTDPNAVTVADVDALRDVGYSDRQVFAITLFVALRLAFSTVNDALGAAPDAELVDLAPAAVGRPSRGAAPRPGSLAAIGCRACRRRHRCSSAGSSTTRRSSHPATPRWRMRSPGHAVHRSASYAGCVGPLLVPAAAVADLVRVLDEQDAVASPTARCPDRRAPRGRARRPPGRRPRDGDRRRRCAARRHPGAGRRRRGRLVRRLGRGARRAPTARRRAAAGRRGRPGVHRGPHRAPRRTRCRAEVPHRPHPGVALARRGRARPPS